jgi:hypothetical protein
MVTREEVQAAVDEAKQLMLECGIDSDVTTDDLIQWFETEVPIPDISLGEVILDPLLVVHELVEIDEILKMGLELTKDVIIKNPEKVDDAHLKAAAIEVMIANRIGAVKHLRKRIEDMEKWCVEKTLSDSRRAEYRRLMMVTKDLLSELECKRPH